MVGKQSLKNAKKINEKLLNLLFTKNIFFNKVFALILCMFLDYCVIYLLKLIAFFVYSLEQIYRMNLNKMLSNCECK